MLKTSLTAILILFISSQVFCTMLYGGTDAGTVALTFDDGPSYYYSSKVLDILEKEKVKATFFLIGRNIERCPDVMKRIVADGHEIGNHTYSHTRISEQDNKTIMNEIEVTNYGIHKYSPTKVTFFRPPHGYFTKSDRALIEKAGYKIVLWRVNADDFYHEGWGMPTPKAITARVMRGVRGGDIILAHDNSQQLVSALPSIIHGLKARGYRFVTLTELVNGPSLAEKKLHHKVSL